jgi:hemerythrin-like domain-containing protein
VSTATTKTNTATTTKTTATTAAGTRGTGALMMPTLHSFFRREIRLAGPLLRRVAPGDTHRSRLVVRHLEFVTRGLHHHHTIEDELLWPRLLERVPQDLAPVVELMQSQHERLDGLLTEIGALLPTFGADAAAADRDRLADLFDDLATSLVEHLDAEEQRLIPLADRTLTDAEWDELGEAGRHGTPRSELSLVLGMYQYEGSPDAIAKMLADAPPPVRWIVPRLSRRAFRRHALRIHGTATP